ncbi:hypothetical protein MFUR16E_12405 [Methylobacterium fujisawaense]
MAGDDGPLPLCGLAESRIDHGTAASGPGAGPLSRAGEGQGEGCDLSGEVSSETARRRRTRSWSV